MSTMLSISPGRGAQWRSGRKEPLSALSRRDSLPETDGEERRVSSHSVNARWRSRREEPVSAFFRGPGASLPDKRVVGRRDVFPDQVPTKSGGQGEEGRKLADENDSPGREYST